MPKPLPPSVNTASGQGAGRPGPPGPPGGAGFTAAGDLSGSPTSQTVTGIHGFPLSEPPSAGDVYTFDGTRWVPSSLTVATNSARDAIPAASRAEGMVVYSQATQCYYELQPDLATWRFKDANLALADQATWYVDPTGNDDNDGKTVGTALATITELMLRLWPHGRRQNLTSDVTAYINTASPAALDYAQLVMNVGTAETTLGSITVHTFNVIVGKVSSAPMTLSSDATIPVASTNQRGQLATSAGTFVADELIEITSGTASGAVGYCNGLNGDAQHAFVAVLTTPTIAATVVNTGHGQNLRPLAGDTCVVTTIVTRIVRVEITCTGFAQVFIQYAKITRLSVNGSSLGTVYGGIGGPVFLSCCQQISVGGRWETNCGGAFMLQCRTPRTLATTLYGSGWCLIGHAIQGTLALNGEALSYGMNVDGGQLRVGIGDDMNHPGESVPSKWLVFTGYTNLFTGGSSGGIEFTNGLLRSGMGPGNNGAAVILCENSEFLNSDNNTYLWGDPASPFDIGIIIMANARAVQGNISLGVLEAMWKIPSVVNMTVDNLFFSFSDNTISIKNSNCGLIGGNYNVANNYNETDSGFYITGQNANVAPTPFFQIKKPGMYKVFGYISVTTADGTATGTPVLNVTWTDDSGVAQTKAVATGPALTTLGGDGGEVLIECGTSLALATWSITGVGSASTSRFSVRMRVEKDCFGG